MTTRAPSARSGQKACATASGATVLVSSVRRRSVELEPEEVAPLVEQDAGVVDEHVEPAGRRLHPARRRGQAARIGHVERERLGRARPGHGAGRGGGADAGEDPAAAGGQRLGDGLADASRGAGDQRHPRRRGGHLSPPGSEVTRSSTSRPLTALPLLARRSVLPSALKRWTCRVAWFQRRARAGPAAAWAASDSRSTGPLPATRRPSWVATPMASIPCWARTASR